MKTPIFLSGTHQELKSRYRYQRDDALKVNLMKQASAHVQGLASSYHPYTYMDL
jgi:hypothetical protein